MKKIQARRKASDTAAVYLEATPRQSHLGRWLLFSVSAVSAVGAFARWIARERRERSMQLVPYHAPGDALAVIVPEPPRAKTQTTKKQTLVAGKKSKLAQAYDAALPTPSDLDLLPTDGREGERRTQQERQANTNAGKRNPMMPSETIVASVPTESAPTPVVAPSAELAETSVATTESKMVSGEEIRDREFPVPEEKTGQTARKLVVDQETLSDHGPRLGGVVGTMPGDTQLKGAVGDIMDEVAETPDFAQQR